jgi:hypothetical protein
VHLPLVAGSSTIAGVRAQLQVERFSLACRHRALSLLELFLLARELPEILKTQRPSAFAI